MSNATPQTFVAALQTGDALGAIAIAEQMLRERQPLGRQWQAIARFAMNECEWPLAIDAMRQFVADEPAVVDRRLALSETLSMAGRSDEVVDELAQLATHHPNNAGILHAWGIALIEIGRREEGVERLRAALRYHPSSGATWVALAGSRTFTRGDAETMHLSDLYSHRGRALPHDRPGICYAFGKALADLGEHDRAFAAYADGAREVARTRLYDAAGDRAAALQAIRAAPPPVSATVGADPASIVMVTGKPRSGTTLIEQMLTAHSGLSHGGEINVLAAAYRLAEQHPASRAAMFRQRYMQLVTARFGTCDGIVDKSLNVSRVAGMTRDGLHDVPLIWVRRDPLDTAWSSFRTYFAQGLGWSFDQTALAEYHAIEDALHAFWTDHYGDRLLTIDYADLVDRPSAVVGKMLAHCGLAHEDGVEQFHRSHRVVQTASVDQVRRPVNRDGIGVAEPYRRHLEPYERAYHKARSSLGLAGYS